VIAPGTDRETTVPARATVVAATLSAMHDENEVEAPDEFRPDRPYSTYIHFGHGLHRCFGEPLNRVQLPALATALLERGPVERAGDLEWEGPYPSSLRVRL
jgi:cytochrome P450